MVTDITIANMSFLPLVAQWHTRTITLIIHSIKHSRIHAHVLPMSSLYVPRGCGGTAIQQFIHRYIIVHDGPFH